MGVQADRRPREGPRPGAFDPDVSAIGHRTLGGLRSALRERHLLPSNWLARDSRGGVPASHALPDRRAGRNDRRSAPAAEVKSRLFGHALVSLPFCVYGGPACDDAEAAKGLLVAAEALGRELRAEYVELRNPLPLSDDWARQDLYVTFRKALAPDAEANLLAVPRKQRAMIRKGAKHGLVSTIDSDTRRFFALYADNVHRHGTPPFSRRYFERLFATFGADCEVLTVVDARGVPVSSVLSFYFRDGVLPYYAGDSVDARDLAANDFKYWELMRRASERGLKTFDYGRSKRGTGSFDFKKNWGFEPTPLAYEYRLLTRDSVPENNPLNPKYRALIAVWRRLPRPLVNAVGPLIVRGLG